MNVIGLSGKKHSGKTTLANFSTKYGYTVINFADKLKEIICDVLCISLKNLEDIKDKNTEIILCKNSLKKLKNELNMTIDKNTFNSIRHLLQYVGTDIIRVNDPMWHIKQVHKKILQNPDIKYCIADCRFMNEKLFIENTLGGKCYYIINNNVNNLDIHISENNLEVSHFNNIYLLYNNDDLDIFFEKNKYIFNI